MRIALVGYGKMGKAIEKIALKRGHEVSLKITIDNTSDIGLIHASNTDIAIEFSTPDSALENVITCLKNNIPTISGSTGWNQNLLEVKNICKDLNGTFLHSSNFSLGVNIFFKINEILAGIMDRHTAYNVSIDETHHIQKKDQPSGTAISLAEGILEKIKRVNKWSEDEQNESIPITSIRENEVPGRHKVTYENEIDRITIEHDAKSRSGFALGAVLVAEWIQDKKGFLSINDFLNL